MPLRRMSRRLTAAFVALAVVLLLAVGVVRWVAHSSEEREQQAELVAGEARAVAAVLSGVSDRGEVVDEELLADFVVPGLRLVYEGRIGERVELTGEGFDAADETVSATVVAADGTVRLYRSLDGGSFAGAVMGQGWLAFLASLALLTLLAGVVGYLVARTLSAPFRQLAVAAAALGRGRFDLVLPHTRVPEAREIAQALESSAEQLRERLRRDHDFGLHTSHVLRTPLTSLRLRLEELAADPALPEEVREEAIGCLDAVGRLSDGAGELVEISGRGALVAEATVPLRDLATQVAQRWSDVLDHDRRALTAAVEGDLELRFTPGPVEQVLDVLLEDVVRREGGNVRLVFEGGDSRLRVDVFRIAEDGTPSAPAHPEDSRLVSTVTGLGGRVEGEPGASVLRVHLPCR